MKKDGPLDLLSHREYREIEGGFHASTHQGNMHEEMVIRNDEARREITINHNCWSCYHDSRETFVIPHERLTYPLVLGRPDGEDGGAANGTCGRRVEFTRESVEFLRAVAGRRGKEFLEAAARGKEKAGDATLP